MSPVTPTRQLRLGAIRRLHDRGLSSREIGRQLDLAPSTVRDYLNDPYREKARLRQSFHSVRGVTMPAGATPITKVKARWARGGPVKGRGALAADARGVQLRAVIGSYAHR